MKTRLVLLPLCALALAAGAPPPAKDAGVSITVKVTDLRNAKGLLRACMTTVQSDFPDCKKTASIHATSVTAREGGVTFTFDGVKPGRYAIALLHDENSNGKADRVLGMMPKEGFGFSRDAPVRMGPPKFSDAAFDMGTSDRELTIRMRYML
ncbi:DUF2141 domain-containing protein [Qipengyuania seohaensis]|uniref:DUF2141 domain-containing protein n=1 Tax=Qipengyuania seohaensis TaxID=266951 RepID=UPI000C226D77|nr:DUF2141 domain-containing protein [Qipengyuania seohaensis]